VPDRAAAVGQPVCGLTVRSAVEEIDALVGGGHRYFRPVWAPDVLGIILGEDTDWDEVGELLVECYCRLAPKMLAAQVDRPFSAGVAVPASGHRPAGRRMRLGLWGRLAGTGTVGCLQPLFTAHPGWHPEGIRTVLGTVGCQAAAEPQAITVTPSTPTGHRPDRRADFVRAAAYAEVS
jgi:hypothetical protein